MIGQVEGAIYQFEVIDELPENGIDVWGMDFGFSNDPTAITHCRVDTGRKEIYLEEICFSTGMLNSDIIECLKDNNIGRTTEIFADCAEPKSIAEISRSGINIKPCNKGGGND